MATATGATRATAGARPRKPAGNRLTAKVGPLPVWGWAVLIVGVGYLAYRHFSSGAGAVSQTAAPQGGAPQPQAGDLSGSADMGGGGASGGGGSSSPAATGPDYSQLYALLGQGFSGLQDQIAAGQYLSPYGATGAGQQADGLGAHPQPGTYLDTTVDRRGVTQFTPIRQDSYVTPASSPSFAAQAKANTAAARAAGKAAPFGGVVSTRKLANGGTLTTYASGRQVQQMPGKSAYVVRA